VALLAALDDRDYKRLLPLLDEGVAIAVSSSAADRDRAIDSLPNLLVMLAGPLRRWRLARGLLHTDDSVAVLEFSAEDSAADGVSWTMEGALGIRVFEGSLRSVSIHLDPV
jgi:hypothetical protein